MNPSSSEPFVEFSTGSDNYILSYFYGCLMICLFLIQVQISKMLGTFPFLLKGCGTLG